MKKIEGFHVRASVDVPPVQISTTKSYHTHCRPPPPPRPAFCPTEPSHVLLLDQYGSSVHLPLPPHTHTYENKTHTIQQIISNPFGKQALICTTEQQQQQHMVRLQIDCVTDIYSCLPGMVSTTTTTTARRGGDGASMVIFDSIYQYVFGRSKFHRSSTHTNPSL